MFDSFPKGKPNDVHETQTRLLFYFRNSDPQQDTEKKLIQVSILSCSYMFFKNTPRVLILLNGFPEDNPSWVKTTQLGRTGRDVGGNTGSSLLCALIHPVGKYPLGAPQARSFGPASEQPPCQWRENLPISINKMSLMS